MRYILTLAAILLGGHVNAEVSTDAKNLIQTIQSRAGAARHMSVTVEATDLSQQFSIQNRPGRLLQQNVTSALPGQVPLYRVLTSEGCATHTLEPYADRERIAADLLTALLVPLTDQDIIAACFDVSLLEEDVAGQKCKTLRILPKADQVELHLVLAAESLTELAVGRSDGAEVHYWQVFNSFPLKDYAFPSAIGPVSFDALPGFRITAAKSEIPDIAALFSDHAWAEARKALKQLDLVAYNKACDALAAGHPENVDLITRIRIAGHRSDPPKALALAGEWADTQTSVPAKMERAWWLARQDHFAALKELAAELRPLQLDRAQQFVVDFGLSELRHARRRLTRAELDSTILRRPEYPFAVRLRVASRFKTLIKGGQGEFADFYEDDRTAAAHAILRVLEAEPGHTELLPLLAKRMKLDAQPGKQEIMRRIQKLYPFSHDAVRAAIQAHHEQVEIGVRQFLRDRGDRIAKEAVANLQRPESDAVECGDALAALYGDGPVALHYRLRKFELSGELEDALPLLAKLREHLKSPKDQLRYAKVYAYHASRSPRLDKALQDLRETDHTLDQWLGLMTMIQANRIDDAKALIPKLKEPCGPELLSHLAQTMLRRAEGPSARVLYEKLLQHDPLYYSTAGLDYARALNADGRKAGALGAIIAYVKTAVDKTEACPAAVRAAHSIRFDRRQLIQLYDVVIEQAPRDITFSWRLTQGRNAMQAGKPDKAEAAILSVIANDPPLAYFEQGASGLLRALYQQNGGLEARMKEIRERYDNDRSNTTLGRFLAISAYSFEHDYARAATILKQLIEKEPRRRNYDSLFMVYKVAKKDLAALELSREMEEKFPSDKIQLQLQRLEFLQSIGQQEKGRQLASDIRRNKKLTHNDYENLAEFYREIGYLDDALLCYRKAEERVTNAVYRGQLQLKRADVLLNANRVPEAITVLRRLEQSATSRFVKNQVEEKLRKLRAEQKNDDYFKKLPAQIRGMTAVPTPGEVIVDGKLDDWDLSATAIGCEDVNTRFDSHSVKLSLMHDNKGLYIAARVTDLSPMQNQIDPKWRTVVQGDRGDCLRLCFRFPDKASVIDCWYVAPSGKVALSIEHGTNLEFPRGGKHSLIHDDPGELRDAFALAFQRHDGSSGYTQELFVPWRQLTDKVVDAGDTFAMLAMVCWGNGRVRDHAFATNLVPGVQAMSADALWVRTANYGRVKLSTEGNLRLPKPRWLQLREAGAAQLSASFASHTGEVRAVRFIPGKKQTISVGVDQVLRIWDYGQVKDGPVLTGHTDDVLDLAIAPAGELAASCGKDKTVRIWDLTTHKSVSVLKAHSATVWSVAFSPDGKYLASCSTDATARIWQVDGWKELATLNAKRGLRSVDFSSDGKRVAAGGLERTIFIWNWQSGKLEQSLRAHDFGIRCVRFSPDDEYLAAGADDMQLTVWSLDDGKLKHRLGGHSSLVTCAEFVSGSKYLLSGSEDGSLRLWDLDSGVELQQIAAEKPGIWSLAINRDVGIVAYGGRDNVIRLVRLPDMELY